MPAHVKQRFYRLLRREGLIAAAIAVVFNSRFWRLVELGGDVDFLASVGSWIASNWAVLRDWGWIVAVVWLAYLIVRPERADGGSTVGAEPSSVQHAETDRISLALEDVAILGHGTGLDVPYFISAFVTVKGVGKPSIVEGWRIRVMPLGSSWWDAKILTTELAGGDFSMDRPDGVTITQQDLINEMSCRNEPLPEGGKVSGHLLGVVPRGLPHRNVSTVGTCFEVSCRDVTGAEATTSYRFDYLDSWTPEYEEYERQTKSGDPPTISGQENDDRPIMLQLHVRLAGIMGIPAFEIPQMRAEGIITENDELPPCMVLAWVKLRCLGEPTIADNWEMSVEPHGGVFQETELLLPDIWSQFPRLKNGPDSIPPDLIYASGVTDTPMQTGSQIKGVLVGLAQPGLTAELLHRPGTRIRISCRDINGRPYQVLYTFHTTGPTKPSSAFIADVPPETSA